jgi:hypothetical protein
MQTIFPWFVSKYARRSEREGAFKITRDMLSP